MDGEAPSITRNEKRVFMVCVDSMSLPFARAHLDRLPVLRSLLAEGALLDLDTPAKYVSASVWPTFATGADPGEHGHYFPFQWDARTMNFGRVSRGAWMRQFYFKPFWHDLARAGVETVSLDAGCLLSVEGAPCTQIDNWSFQDSGAASASNPSLLRELRRRFGRRPISAEVPVPKTLKQSRAVRDGCIKAVKRKADATLWLMDQSDWRLFLVGFYEAHRAAHNLWCVEGDFGSEVDPDALLDFYVENDRQLGRVLEKASDGNTTCILFSLHGMKPNYVQDHFLWKIMARLNARYLEERGEPPRAPRKDNIITYLRKNVPYPIQYAIAQRLGEVVQDWVVNRGLIGGLDWSRTPAFRLSSGGEGYIRLNIKGREQQGFFEPGSEALDHYKKWLKERLLEIKVAGTEEPLIAAVREVSDLFPGARRDLLPDLILEWGPEKPAEKIHSSAIGELTEHLATGRGGNHCGDSFMLVTGPGAQSPDLAQVRHIRDIRRFVEAQFAGSESAARADSAIQADELASA
jgi:predicted AlkP superfamily phosphohydrolase/phosphomutase